MFSRPSICIPILKEFTSKGDIVRGLQPYCLGEIANIDLVWKNYDGLHLQQAFIHFKRWNVCNPVAEKIRCRLLANKSVNLMYSMPRFWHCEKSHTPRPVNQWLKI